MCCSASCKHTSAPMKKSKYSSASTSTNVEILSYDLLHHRRRPVTSSEQIECVVTWASRIARGNTAKILNPAEIHRRFEEVFPEIMANYWKVCSPLTKEERGMDSSGTSQQDSAEKDLLGSMVDATVAEAKAQDSSSSSSSSSSAQRVHMFYIFASHALTMVSVWVLYHSKAAHYVDTDTIHRNSRCMSILK